MSMQNTGKTSDKGGGARLKYIIGSCCTGSSSPIDVSDCLHMGALNFLSAQMDCEQRPTAGKNTSQA